MKKFIHRLFLLLLIIAGIDFAVGKVFSMMQRNAISGDNYRLNIITNQQESQMLIVGSSRAVHHYDPFILQDSLGITCYNCGIDGMGIVNNYGNYLLITSRYKPKVLVCEITPDFDLLTNDNSKYLGWLKPHYDQQGIDSIFWAVDNTLRLKMLSQMYRYNGDFIQIGIDFIHPMPDGYKDNRGYTAINSTMEYEPEIADNKDETENVWQFDTLKLTYWDRLIENCQHDGTQLIFIVSPQYKATATDMKVFQPIILKAKRNSIPFITHLTDTTFCTKREYFNDVYHLNKLGATEYTKAITKEIRPYIY